MNFGKQQQNTNQVQSTTLIEGRNSIQPGWTCYPKNKTKEAKMNLESLAILHRIFARDNALKNRRLTADRAQMILYEEMASRDWCELALATESRIKAFFEISSAN